MRVLYLVEQYADEDPRWHRGLFRHLADRGVGIEVLNLNRSPSFREAVAGLVDSVVELEAPGSYWKALPELRQRMKDSEADLVHGVELIPTFYAAVARWLLLRRPRPLIYGRHHLRTRGLQDRVMEAVAFAGSAEVVAVSEEAGRIVREEHPTADPAKVAVVHNGIAVTEDRVPDDGPDANRDRSRRSAGLHGPFTVLLLARLRPEKGHGVALDAAERLRAEDREVRWIFAGEGPSRADLEEEIRDRGLDGSVELAGWVDDVAGLLDSADVLVVPSRWESFGLVAVEAMAMGVPVVASDVGGLPEIVEDGETGILLPPGDPGALATALERLMDDPGRARRLGRAGRRRYLDRFTPEAMARGYLERYRSLLDRGRSGSAGRRDP